MHIVFLREAGIIVRVGSNKTGYWKINIYNYGTAHYGGAFSYGKIGQLDKCPFRNSIVGQSREKVVCGDKIATGSDIMAEKRVRHII